MPDAALQTMEASRYASNDVARPNSTSAPDERIVLGTITALAKPVDKATGWIDQQQTEDAYCPVSISNLAGAETDLVLSENGDDVEQRSCACGHRGKPDQADQREARHARNLAKLHP